MVHDTWKEWIGNELNKPYFLKLKQFLKKRLDEGATIYPPQNCWTKALEFDPQKIQVVILGQDPYHGPQQAHGYAFSVLPGIKPPPSLKNIYKELQDDIPNVQINPESGLLNRWVQQGVLLLNTVLTVEAGKPESHKGKGWEQFTDCVIKTLSEKNNNIVFILWGAHAGKKSSLIDHQRHCIIRSAHPSPLSAHNGFFGSKPFSKTNTYLQNHDKPGIDWSLN